MTERTNHHISPELIRTVIQGGTLPEELRQLDPATLRVQLYTASIALSGAKPPLRDQKGEPYTANAIFELARPALNSLLGIPNK